MLRMSVSGVKVLVATPRRQRQSKATSNRYELGRNRTNPYGRSEASVPHRTKRDVAFAIRPLRVGTSWRRRIGGGAAVAFGAVALGGCFHDACASTASEAAEAAARAAQHSSGTEKVIVVGGGGGGAAAAACS